MTDSLEREMRKAMISIHVKDLRNVKGSPASKIKSEHVPLAVKALVDDPLLPEASDSVRNALDAWIQYNPHTLSDYVEKEDTDEEEGEGAKEDAQQADNVTPDILKRMDAMERLNYSNGVKTIPPRLKAKPLPPEVAAMKPLDRLGYHYDQIAKRAEEKKGDNNTNKT